MVIWWSDCPLPTERIRRMERKRVDGFVVGKDKVRGQDTWKVRVKDEGSSLNGCKLLVASVWPGVTLARSMDVSFSISGQTHAVNVAPCGVNTEGYPDMRKRNRFTIAGIGVLLVLVLAALAGAFNLHRYEPIRDFIVELRADWALDSVRELVADEVITDDVVRVAIRNGSHLRSASWAAREEVFAEHQCYIFGLELYDDAAKTCHEVHYYEGSDDPWVYKKTGVPSAVTAEFLPETRKILFGIAREHLMTPANTWAVYRAKREVALDEFERLDTEAQENLVYTLIAGIGAFEQFRDDAAARAAWHKFLELENEWMATDWGSDQYDAAWDAMQAQEEIFFPMLGEQRDLYLFAGRRHMEGGDELIDAYIEIGYDLIGHLSIEG